MAGILGELSSVYPLMNVFLVGISRLCFFISRLDGIHTVEMYCIHFLGKYTEYTWVEMVHW